jgi:hypothetical protein
VVELPSCAVRSSFLRHFFPFFTDVENPFQQMVSVIPYFLLICTDYQQSPSWSRYADTPSNQEMTSFFGLCLLVVEHLMLEMKKRKEEGCLFVPHN